MSHVKPPKTVFVCQECGGQQPKWVGRCPDCGAWNSLVEEQAAPQTAPAAANHRYGLVSGGRIRQALQRYSDVRRAADFLGHRTSSIASSAAASSPVRSCCSAASRASENPRCCCRWPRTLRATSVRFFTARARSPSTRSSCAASGCRSIAHRCISSPKPASSASSKRSSG